MAHFIPKSAKHAVAAAVLGAALLAATSEAQAQYRYYGGPRYHHHRGIGLGGALAVGAIGALTLGAIAASAQPRYYAPAPVYAPDYDGGCFLERRRFWNGYRYVVRRVEVCD